MLVRQFDPMVAEDVECFKRVHKLSKEVGNPEGILRIMYNPNYSLLCFDEKGMPIGCTTYCVLPKRTNAMCVGYVMIAKNSKKKYAEVFHAMFDEVLNIAGDHAILMELDNDDKEDIRLALSRSFKKVPIDFDSIGIDGVPYVSSVSLFVRSLRPIANWEETLLDMYHVSYRLPNAENDPRVKRILEQVGPLNGRF